MPTPIGGDDRDGYTGPPCTPNDYGGWNCPHSTPSPTPTHHHIAPVTTPAPSMLPVTSGIDDALPWVIIGTLVLAIGVCLLVISHQMRPRRRRSAKPDMQVAARHRR
jgi:hypothetical protein